MKKTLNTIFLSLILSLYVTGCSKNVIERTEPVTKTMIATVVGQKGVLVGEFEDGPRPVEKNITENIITWEGYHLVLRSETGDIYEYLSKELFYEGDRLLIRVQDGEVISVKYSP
ncbi:MAG: hypothetical protein R6V47_04240 [Candidatus Delongbacteria bacterium]